ADGWNFIITPTTTRVLTLPTTDVKVGNKIHFTNLAATQEITIEASGGADIATFQDGSMSLMALQDTPTTAAHWRIMDVHGSAALGSITREKLKTAIGEVSSSTTAGIGLTLPGGEYGFYPQSKHNPTSFHEARIAFGLQSQSYITNIWFNVVGGIGFAQQRYIQASPPYNLGDGDIPVFIFVIINKIGKVESIYVAPDPPWANNGPTDIRANFDRSGKSFKLVKNFPARPNNPTQAEAWIDAVKNAPLEEVEITQAVKQADMLLIPHPFLGNDLTDKKVVLLDPVGAFCYQCLELHEAGESISELLFGGYIEINNTPLDCVVPPGVIACQAKWKNAK
ncbi:hypothetical protein LCGC14_2781230, partial [marine sediment metagenome]